MQRYIVFILFLLMSFVYGYGQKIAYFGKISDKDGASGLAGVTVSAINNGTTASTTTTASDGKYKLEFDPGKNYTIKYSKPGYITKIIKVETEKVNPEDMPPGGKIFPPIDMDLFKDVEGADFSYLEDEPVVTWYFDRAGMNWDRRQASRMKKKIENTFEEAKDHIAEQEAEYNSLIQAADGLFKAEKYKEALEQYSAALQIPGKQTEEYPSQQIVKIGDLLQALEEQELAAKQDNQEYANFISAADNLAADKKYEKAIDNYNKALEIKPDEQYPKDKIAEVQEAKANASKRDEYDQIIKSADMFFNQNSLKAARDKYQKALKLLPNESYPQQQLDKIKEQLEAKSEQLEKQKKYNEAVEAADNFFDKEQYEDAISKYKEAITYESASTYPPQRIELAEQKLAEQNAQKEKEEQFKQLVADGNTQLNLKNYKEAVDKYDQALALIQDEAIQNKRDDTQKLLDQLQENEEQANQITALLKTAKEKLDDKDYQGAIDDFTSVLTLDDQNATAIEGKKNAELLLSNMQDLEAQEEQFNQLVADADKAFDDENLEEAKDKYIAAKAIFNDKPHVNNRIDEIQALLEKQKRAEETAAEIQVLLDQAEQLKLDNKWSQVIQKYKEALNLDNQRDDIAALLEDAQMSKAEWDAQQSEEEKFNQLKHEGEVLMTQKRWEEAKSKFEEALAVKDEEEIHKKLETIEEKLAENLASEEQEKAYVSKMEQAEEYATSNDYENAISTFQEALEIKKGDATALSRIQDMQQKIEQLEKEKQKDKRYAEAMDKGQKAFNEEDYAAAIKFYDDALIEKPLDADATRLKKAAKTKLSNLQSEEEIYQELLSKAQKLYDDGLIRNNDIPTLKEAKKKFEEAQDMRPKASVPQNKIVEIDRLIREIEEDENQDQEKQKAYEDKLDLASIAAQNSKYQNAIDYLKEASAIKPDEDFPKQKIKEYEDLLNQIASQEELEKQYSDKIREADASFDNGTYEESIDLYNEALAIKAGEDYPKSQIRKAKKAIKEQNTNAVITEYNKHIVDADKHFMNSEFEDAIDDYKAALEVINNDDYAQQKLEESQEALDEQRKRAAKNTAEQKAFDKHIRLADSLFNEEEFLAAKEEYEKGLMIDPNDVYANEQAKLCVHKSGEKTREGDEKRYQKILTVADRYFDEENYDKAANLYKRAVKFRSTDQYPKDKLAEITAIKNGNAKTKSNIEDLGEKSDISIMEGAALLEEGAKQRENLKLEAIQNELNKHEGNAKDRADKDYAERTEYRKEVITINDLMGENDVDEREKHQVFIDHVNDIEYNWEQQVHERSQYEQGDVDRAYRNVVYIDDAMDKVKREMKDNHDGIIEKIRIIEKDRDRQNEAESAKNRANIEVTSDELLAIQKKNEKIAAANKEKQEDLQVRVDAIIKGREVQTHQERNDNYSKVMQLQNDATLAEIKDAESKEDKLAINKQLQEDIEVLAAAIQRKNEQESDETYLARLEVESQLSRTQDNYDETRAKKDEDRQEIVERVKDIELDQLKQAEKRAKEYYQTTQDNLDEVEKVEIMQEQQAMKNKKDLEAIDEGVKAREMEIERANELRSKQEKNDHERTTNRLERIEKQYELTTKGKEKQTEQNYEDVKGLAASIDDHEQERMKIEKDKKMETQKLVNQLENNSIAFSEKIANTIGDEYPEGVSQEVYVRKDKDGIPVRIITRRFVVTNGHGDIYIRIQSRNGITYSKNGTATTEQSWINGTEDANLAKHY